MGAVGANPNPVNLTTLRGALDEVLNDNIVTPAEARRLDDAMATAVRENRGTINEKDLKQLVGAAQRIGS